LEGARQQTDQFFLLFPKERELAQAGSDEEEQKLVDYERNRNLNPE
jgi:hypothetical protein